MLSSLGFVWTDVRSGFRRISAGRDSTATVKRQPEGVLMRISPFPAVFQVCGKEEVISGIQVDSLLCALPIEGEGAAPSQKDDPFIPLLIIPFSIWCCVATGNDPFQPHECVFQESFEEFVWKV